MDNGKEKHRLIANCKELNQYFRAPPFRLDHIGTIFPYLRRGMWAAKIDLKNAYFHLGLGIQLRPYVCMMVGGTIYQFQAACFGISPLPWLWMQIMKVFLHLWRPKGILVFIYIDDILLLGSTPLQVEKHLSILMRDLENGGMEINQAKSILRPTQKVEHLGFILDLEQGTLQVPRKKLENIVKELRKMDKKSDMNPRQMAAILGVVRSFLCAMPLLRAFTDMMVNHVSKSQNHGWDKKLPLGMDLKEQVKMVITLMEEWKGRPFQDKIPVRTLYSDSSDLAWAGVDAKNGTIIQEFWRERGHLHINVKELHAAMDTIRSLAKPGELVTLRVDNSVTYYYLKKTRRKDFKNECTCKTVFRLVHEKQCPFGRAIDKKRPMPGRWAKSMGVRPQRLLPKSGVGKISDEKICPPDSSGGGHVCLARQCSPPKICIEMATLAGMGGGCPGDADGGGERLLCQPPLDTDSAVASPLEGKPPCQVPHDNSVLGFKCVVAPTSSAIRAQLASNPHPPILGNVYKLHGRAHAPATMAPALCDCIRRLLQGRQASPSGVEGYLARIKGRLERYNGAWMHFVTFCCTIGIDVLHCNHDALAGCLVEFHQYWPNESKMAYASVILLPGFDQIRFHPMLKPLKREWNKSEAKYATFWDAQKKLRLLQKQNLDWSSIAQLRLRLIMLFRIIMLFRSVDLERCWRTISRVEDSLFLMVRRKGHQTPRWEEVPALKNKDISPKDVLLGYVALTHNQVPHGGPLLVQLQSPYKILKANSIASLTKCCLKDFGLDVRHWQPHSTRGAGVLMYKNLGLTSDEVCEIGKWKNPQAFAAHYLRLGAVKKASQKIQEQLVHNVSPCDWAYPDMACTSRKKPDLEGNVMEGYAQDHGETDFFFRRNVHCF